ncbi:MULTISPECIES: L-serine ammonia-lyase [Pseudovibrio]|uniref:L-serine ammonia-lyase n=1 Tax=Stappiaceae TaxID=2821832 RepID=UPI0023656F46|nr:MULTISPECIES: L-serine ammonia-lyase [Pseudovibrio]MDD7909357.1 L-serine ammonia-lyase [Pseudovibrio exalbescens]MDX5594916.1 L-serine ammonia-lyase [Pseudovibrio sp. SPO723]
MFLSIFEIFKVGIGPSSSHTMGPMVAAAKFLDELRDGSRRWPGAGDAAAVKCILHGSLAWTGKGHATDKAVVLGLAGCTPETLDPEETEAIEASIAAHKQITPEGLPALAFNPETDVVFDFEANLPGHANGMVLEAYDAAGALHFREIYYSVGGGFVLTQDELSAMKEGKATLATNGELPPVPFPFASAKQMLELGTTSGKSVAEMKLANEQARQAVDDLDAQLWRIWSVMDKCIERGLQTEGILPGGLQVKRRAAAIYRQLQEERGLNMSMPHVANDWLSVYAMAVNEENAAGGQVVTAPTNGAAGVIPATIKYYRDHCPGSNDEGIRTFLLTAAAIGGIIKHNASISGAEVGCQGEVGSAAAMAAAGLCAALGGTNEQIENAAEIALEHHLGMTCDPAKGLVQVPCIERNGLGAIKAVSAASLALRGDGSHYMPLDNCVEAMRQTGEEMNDKYKETSLGGLAVNLPEC